ncbi:MAG: hypothetical protein V2A74_01895 [bacterium]
MSRIICPQIIAGLALLIFVGCSVDKDNAVRTARLEQRVIKMEKQIANLQDDVQAIQEKLYPQGNVLSPEKAKQMGQQDALVRASLLALQKNLSDNPQVAVGPFWAEKDDNFCGLINFYHIPEPTEVHEQLELALFLINRELAPIMPATEIKELKKLEDKLQGKKTPASDESEEDKSDTVKKEKDAKSEEPARFSKLLTADEEEQYFKLLQDEAQQDKSWRSKIKITIQSQGKPYAVYEKGKIVLE